MSKDKGSFDIAKAIAPLVVDAPSLGRVALGMRTAGFLSWLEKGLQKRRWGDQRQFVRDLLSEHGSLQGEAAAPLYREAIVQLDDAQLDAIAGKIVAASKRQFAPPQAADAKTGKLRAQTEEDPDPLVASAGESDSAHLLRILESYLGYFQARARELIARIPSVDPLSSMFGKFGAISSAIGSERALQRAHDRLGIAAAWESPFSAMIERLRPNPILEQQRRIAEQIDQIMSPVRRIQEAMLGLPGRERRAGLNSLERIFADQGRWSSVVGSYFGLGLPARLQSSMAGGAASLEAARVIQSAAMTRPAFSTAAMLGLNGLAPRGAVADLLKHYDEAPKPSAPAFGAVLTTAVTIDSSSSEPDRLETALAEALNEFRQIIAEKEGPLKNQALVSLFALVVSLYAAIIGTLQFLDGGTAEIARRIEGATEELRRLNQSVAADRGVHAARERLRYIHRVANLRAEPGRGGILIRLVYPDQIVRVLETRGDWALVEVFDYPSDAPVRGWLHRRYLRIGPQ